MSETEPEATQQEFEPRLALGLTPFGQIGISVTDQNGTTVSYVIQGIEEASQTAMHMTALVTMMIQSMYARVMQEREQVQALLDQPKVWTPKS